VSRLHKRVLRGRKKNGSRWGEGGKHHIDSRRETSLISNKFNLSGYSGSTRQNMWGTMVEVPDRKWLDKKVRWSATVGPSNFGTGTLQKMMGKKGWDDVTRVLALTFIKSEGLKRGE